MTRRYAKPGFGIQATRVGGDTVEVTEDSARTVGLAVRYLRESIAAIVGPRCVPRVP